MQDNNKYSFSFFSFNAHQTPEFKHDKRKEWVIFGTEKEYYDDYPRYLLENYEKSATHNAICNAKINYIVGQGLQVEEYSKPEDLAKSKAFIRSVNEYQDADDLNRCIVTDLVIFGGFYVEVIKAKDGSVGGFYHLDFNKLRRDKEEADKWYYTCDWDSRKPQDNEDFKTFYEFNGTFESGKEYLLSYRNYRAGDYPYALPDYLSANSVIEADWRISNFLLNNVKSGLSAGFLINFYNGMPTEEEKSDIEKRIKKKFTGDDAGGSFILNFSHAESKSAEVTPIPTNGHDDRFNLLDKRNNEKLFVAHNVTSPMLMGVKTEGQLGGRTEMIEAFELMQNTYTANRQRLVKKFWNDALYFKDVDAKLEIVPTKPIQEKLTVQELLPYLTQDEIRESAGYEPLNNQASKTVTQFADETDNAILDHFASCGISNEDFEVVYERGIMAGSIEEAMEFAEVATFENQVLDLINQGNTPQRIAEVLNTTNEKVMEAVYNLESEGYLNLKEGEIKTTAKGSRESNDEYLMVYKYALRPDAPPLKGESRPFCRQLMALSSSRSWTIEDIRRMRNGMNLDVFTHRGGWYTKPDTDIRIPYCRHRWVGQLVKLRK